MTDSNREEIRGCSDVLVGRLWVWWKFRHSDTSNDGCHCSKPGTNLDCSCGDLHGTDDYGYNSRYDCGTDDDCRHVNDRTDNHGYDANDHGTDDHRGSDNNGGTDDYCSPVYHHGSTYNHRGAGNDNRSSRYDGRPNHNHPVRSSVRSWRPSC